MRRRHNAAVLAVYTLAALLLTWPLLRHFATHVPGDGIDDPSLAWNLWWLKERLIDQVNVDIFHVDWMFHPIGINLGFYTLTPLNGLLSIPLQTAFTLIIANNVILLSSFIIGGFGVYLLTKQEINHQQATNNKLNLPAFLAGLVYAFASSKLFYVSLGQFNIASSQWIPFCAFYLLRLARATSWRSGFRNALFAGIFLTLQAWAELTYASFLLIFAAFVFLWSFFHTGRRALRLYSGQAQHLSRITSFAVCGLVFLLGIAPFLWAMLPDLRREGDFFASGGGFADDYSADLAGYLLPTRLHPLFGNWVDNFTFPHTLGQQIYVGYGVLLLALVGGVTLVRQPRLRRNGLFWVSTTLVFWWLTLGAQVRWLGEASPIPGPFALISRLPFFSGNRYPSRYSVMLLLGVAVLAGAGVMALLRRQGDGERGRQEDRRTGRQRWGLVSGLVLLFLLEHLSIPLPLSDFRIPSIYQQLAAGGSLGAGDFTVLELPTGWRNGARVLGKSDILIMMQQWYQTVHGKRRLGGNTSRNPAYKFQYFTQAPLIGDLIALMNAEPASNPAHNEIARVVESTLDELIVRDSAIAGQVLDFLGVQYVTVHVDKSPPMLLRFVDEALPVTLIDEWHGPDWSGKESTIRLYRVMPSPSANQEIDLATSEGQLFLAEGWSGLVTDGVRYATHPCADLLLKLPDSGGQLWVQLRGPQQTAALALNGQTLGTVTVPTEEEGALVTVPAGQATKLIDRLQLCFARRTALTELARPATPQGWVVGATGAYIARSLVIQSAGKDVGDFAHIWLEGVDVAPQGIGYNLVAFDATGMIQGSRSFNTLTSPADAQAMAGWLQQWPPGTIIAGAVRDEASNNLTEEAVLALQQIGVATDLRGRFRWSHAFIGVAGAPPASAVEAASLLQPAAAAVGIAVDASAVYGGVGRVRFQANP